MIIDTSDVDRDELGRPSQLFLVRVWVRRASGARPRWYGRVQHVVTGEVHTFEGATELATALLGMIPDAGRPASGASPGAVLQADPSAAPRQSPSIMRTAQPEKETDQC